MVRVIGSSLGKYINIAKPKGGIQASACICIEVDVEKGLLVAIQLTLVNWTYLLQMDYE
jgi:hypothetical protein